MNKIRRKYLAERKFQSGATLVVIIITMLIVAIIGTALYSITATSTINQAIAQASAKAYYLAESGIRVASSEFRSVPQYNVCIDNYVARNNKLISLQGQEFPLPNNLGKFSLSMSSAWLYAQTAQTGATITLYFSGDLRPDLKSTFPAGLPTGGILKRKGYTSIAFFNSPPAPPVPPWTFSAPNGTPIKFTFAAAYPYTFNAGDEGYIGYAFNPSPSSPQTVNAGGNLVLINTNNTGAIFPPQNGTIYVEHIATYAAPSVGSGQSYPVMSQYTYDQRTINTVANTVTLTNIQAVPCPKAPAPACSPAPACPPPGFPLVIVYNAGNLTTLTQTSRIYLGKTITIQSTSTYGN
jgi:hypothetical protein